MTLARFAEVHFAIGVGRLAASEIVRLNACLTRLLGL
jgi:hypothetical protein